MRTITLQNGRASSDTTFRVKLRDGGLYVDWTGLSNIKAYIYSDVQKALAGRCDVRIDPEDNTILVCEYAATKPQYLGVNSIVIRAKYQGREKTYDKKAINYVSRTFESAGTIILDDPVVDIDLFVEDVSTSMVEKLVAACVKATEDARQITMVHVGPAAGFGEVTAEADNNVGTPSVEVNSSGPDDAKNFHFILKNFKGTPGERGPQGIQGETGPQGERGPQGIQGETGPQGERGPQGIQGETGPQGERGPQGIQGETGPQGERGPQGIQGETGPQGERGPQGEIGPKGERGEKGETGDPGSSQDYPFTLANNRTTNDPSKALTAAEGYRIGIDLDLLQQSVYVPIEDYEVVNYTINSSTGKFGTNVNYQHLCKAVTEGEIYVVGAPSDKSCCFAFVTTDEATAGSDVPLVNGTAITSIPAGGNAKVVIPSGCSYLLVYNESNARPFDLRKNTAECILEMQKEDDEIKRVGQYQKPQYFGEFIDNTNITSSYPRVNSGFILSPKIKANKSTIIVLSSSVPIACYNSNGNIASNPTSQTPTLHASTEYVRVCIPKDTNGFTISVDGVVVLTWTDALYNDILVYQNSHSDYLLLNKSGQRHLVFPIIFDGTPGNPANTVAIRTEMMNVTPGMRLRVRPNVALSSPGAIYSFIFTTYNSAGTLVRSSSNAEASQQVLVGNSERYVVFQIFAYNANSDAIALRATNYQDVLDILIDYPAVIDWKKYLPMVQNLIYSGGSRPANQSNPLVLGHFSDIHGSQNNLDRIADFRAAGISYIHDFIHTGDAVFTSFADSFDWSHARILNVIGNHDTAKVENGVYDFEYYAGKQAYDRYFAPYISRWGVNQPEGANENGYCYYYKDYATPGVRLIVLDAMKWDATQLVWLDDTLADALSNGLAVIIAVHYPSMSGTTKLDCNFTSALSWLPGDRFPSEIASSVDTFIDDGGHFICYLTGHSHIDQVGYIPDHHNQLCVTVASASIDSTNLEWGDMARSEFSETQDLFNVIAFDATQHEVRIIRVGACYDKQLRHKSSIVIAYEPSGETAPIVVREN